MSDPYAVHAGATNGSLYVTAPSPRKDLAHVPVRWAQRVATFPEAESVPTTQTALRRCASTFDRLARLAYDWDSYGGLTPTPLAISRGRALAYAIPRRIVNLVGDQAWPNAIVPASDGGVQLEWHGPQSAIEVEIGPTGNYAYLVIDDQATPRFQAGHGVPVGVVVEAVTSILLPRRRE